MGFMKGVSLFSGISCFGILIAAIIGQLNTSGIFIDDLITRYSWSITDIQTIIVILFMLIAGVLAVVASD